MAQAINKRGSMVSDPVRNFRFVARFNKIGQGESWTPSPAVGFSSISGLNLSTESIPYREGHHNTTVQQVPGQTTFTPVTFQRGVVLGTKQHWDWMRMLFRVNDPASTKLAPQNSFRANISVRVLVHPVAYSTATGYGTDVGAQGISDDLVAMRFTIYNAWPTSVAYSDLNAGDNALLVEQLTVVHEGFEVDWASTDDNGNITGVTNN